MLTPAASRTAFTIALYAAIALPLALALLAWWWAEQGSWRWQEWQQRRAEARRARVARGVRDALAEAAARSREGRV